MKIKKSIACTLIGLALIFSNALTIISNDNKTSQLVSEKLELIQQNEELKAKVTVLDTQVQATTVNIQSERLHTAQTARTVIEMCIHNPNTEQSNDTFNRIYEQFKTTHNIK